MTLEDLGYSLELEANRQTNNLESFDVARIIAEHKERYTVKTAKAEYEAEITGQLRFTAKQRTDFPAVGDWVAISEYGDKALIHAIFPRKSSIEREAVGKHGEKQIIATNIDFGLIVQAVDRDFNLNRIERYLTICYASHVEPLVVLTKSDLIEESELASLISKVEEREEALSVIAISNYSKEGLFELKNKIEHGRTYCLLGSSGVGKSSLLNNLLGREKMKTNAISETTNKGKHVTTHRELVVLPDGGIIIDNPGMREVGIADASAGLEKTFERLIELAATCKFIDCTHTSEVGCAILDALEGGEIDQSFYDNYQKMKREEAHFESTVAQRRKKEKEFGKMIKHYKQNKRHSKE